MSLALPVKGDSGRCGPILLNGSPLAELDRQRQALGVKISVWQREAAVSRSALNYYLAGIQTPSRPVLQRLAAALDRLTVARGDGDAAMALLIATSFGGFQAQAAAMAPLFASPGKCALLARDIALYSVNQMAGVRQAALARHAGLTRARVCQAIRQIEDRRDAEPAFDRAIAQLMRTISGQEE